jgi:hypothetical protein
MGGIFLEELRRKHSLYVHLVDLLFALVLRTSDGEVVTRNVHLKTLDETVFVE